VGVPVIVPVCDSMVRPAGSAGDTLHCAIAPPLWLSVLGMIAVPSAYTTEKSR